MNYSGMVRRVQTKLRSATRVGLPDWAGDFVAARQRVATYARGMSTTINDSPYKRAVRELLAAEKILHAFLSTSNPRGKP